MTVSTFINLVVSNPVVSRAFFEALGFVFIDEFSNEDAVCMVINNNTYATLMKPDRFLKYTPFHVALPHKHTQVLVALQQSGKEEVDALMTKAISMGAVEFRAAQDHGLMYARSFHDHDGNIFEIFWMQMPSLA